MQPPDGRRGSIAGAPEELDIPAFDFHELELGTRSVAVPDLGALYPVHIMLRCQFVLRLRIEVACSLAFVQLLSRIAYSAIDHPTALN